MGCGGGGGINVDPWIGVSPPLRSCQTRTLNPDPRSSNPFIILALIEAWLNVS